MTSPVIAGMFVYGLIYVSKCNNDSHLAGIRYFEQGNYTKALKYFDEYLMLHPHHIQTLYNRGSCYAILGQFEKAENDYVQVIERQRDHVNAILGLSQLYYARQDYKSTLNLTRHAMMIEPEHYLAQYYHGRACHKMGKLSDALDAYNACIDLNPDFGFAYFHRGSVMLSFGMPPFGCYDLKTAISLGVEGSDEAFKKYCGDSRNMLILE